MHDDFKHSAASHVNDWQMNLPQLVTSEIRHQIHCRHTLPKQTDNALYTACSGKKHSQFLLCLPEQIYTNCHKCTTLQTVHSTNVELVADDVTTVNELYNKS